MPPRRSDQLNGEHALYHYLQKELLEQDVWLFQAVVTRLAIGLGIWISPATYARLPLLKPYARRDPRARQNVRLERPEQWGSPDESGRFRDDNSLIKRLPFTLPIEAGTNRSYSGKRVAQGFVCAHVWRDLADGEPATRDWRTYSFVPNLVWLPEQVAKLSDRPGSFVQTYLQAVSLKLYRDVEISAGLRPIVENSWELLQVPTGIPPQSLPETEELNLFSDSDRFVESRRREIERVAEAVRAASSGAPIGRVSRRYRAGLPDVSRRALRRLLRELTEYLTAVGRARPADRP